MYFYQKKFAYELWTYDQIKMDVAKANNFKTLVVWQKDFIEDPKKIIEECLMFLKNN